MAEAWLHRQIGPDVVARGIQAESRAQFLDRFGDTPFLLINLRSGDNELESNLQATAPIGSSGVSIRPSSDAMGFHTALPSNTGEPGSSRMRKHSVFVASTLALQLVHLRFFAVPLRKRLAVESPSAERISLGRTLNRDIVLRHPSVSKFHGWFEMDESIDFYYHDGGSRNGTRLNDIKLPSREPHLIEPGDTLAFGSIHAILCPPDTLWDSLHL